MAHFYATEELAKIARNSDILNAKAIELFEMEKDEIAEKYPIISELLGILVFDKKILLEEDERNAYNLLSDELMKKARDLMENGAPCSVDEYGSRTVQINVDEFSGVDFGDFGDIFQLMETAGIYTDERRDERDHDVYHFEGVGFHCDLHIEVFNFTLYA